MLIASILGPDIAPARLLGFLERGLELILFLPFWRRRRELAAGIRNQFEIDRRWAGGGRIAGL